MKRAIFLDRDGTINVDTGYLSDPNSLVLICGAKEGIKLLKENGFYVFIVTNQSGVGRGYFSLKKLRAVNEKLLNELSKSGISIDDVYFCPHHPKEKCECRKPNIKMLINIVEKHKIVLESSYFVGDKLIDVQTGKNAGCRTVLIDTDTDSLIEYENDWTHPDFVAKNLKEAAKWIIKDNNRGRKKVKK